jgi:DNA-binding LacI/PurR family transcriptional regulator
MKDVATFADVSVSTVSYVLNGTGPVSADRRARVLNAVRDLNYIPNESARSLKRQSASTIGLVIPDLSNQFFSLLAQGVAHAAAARDMLVVLCSSESTEEVESANARLLRSQRVDGVVYLTGFHESPSSLLELQSLGPVVLVDERVPGADLPAVLADGRRGARSPRTSSGSATDGSPASRDRPPCGRPSNGSRATAKRSLWVASTRTPWTSTSGTIAWGRATTWRRRR